MCVCVYIYDITKIFTIVDTRGQGEWKSPEEANMECTVAEK